MAIETDKYKKAYKIIGNNIRLLRKKLNISQEQLAFKLDSARNYIGCIERAEKLPSLEFLFRIADVLKCNIKDFFRDIN